MKELNIDGTTVQLRKHHFSKNLRITVRSGKALVTMPRSAPYKLGEAFARRKLGWIKQQLQNSSPRREPTAAERKQARQVIESKLQEWGEMMGLQWGSIRIGNQKTRWGSCSSTGTLSFNWQLILIPDEIVDYIVVHELAHIAHPNHSPAFWKLVERHIADYKLRRRKLKQIDLNKH